MVIAAIILILTYIGIIFTRLPHTNFDRPAAALTGALLMILFRVLTFQQAISAINFETLALLLGMMLLLVVLQQADFFNIVASRSVSIARTPWQLLILIVAVTGLSSAFLVNDVVVLIFTPIIIHTCRLLKINPVPYLLAEAMASNIGSTATIVGNPQNMLIGTTSGISFIHFIKYLAPVSLVSSVILITVIYLFYRKQMSSSFSITREDTYGFSVISGQPAAADRKRLLTTVLPILALTIAALFLSSVFKLSIPVIALVGGVAAIVLSGIRPSKLIRSVDWALLLFFAGLFIVIGGASQSGLLDMFMGNLRIQADAAGIFYMQTFSVLISQIVSNVPLTMLVIPMIQNVPGDVLWISLAAGATLGGNATILGSIANIIVIEQAYRHDVKINWWEFSKTGLVVTSLTVAASIGILILELNLGILK
jgi:Na+/H+ antiporter NhaD/arsenite permease-like protein